MLRKIVLDTNVLLVSISSKSKLHWLFKGLLNEEFILCVTTDILLEYAEIIEKHMGKIASESALGVLENLPNVLLINNYFKFNILLDPDDNKFVDCAIAANADFIVTHDKDFETLKKLQFPKIKVIDTVRFFTLHYKK
jgi:putative PIN family toxin of toxin-antitoxin system